MVWDAFNPLRSYRFSVGVDPLVPFSPESNRRCVSNCFLVSACLPELSESSEV